MPSNRTIEDESFLKAMGTAYPTDPHHDCMVRWLEEREQKNSAVHAAQQAWSLMDSKNSKIDNLEWNCEVLSWSAAVGWIIAIVAVVIAIVK